MIPSCRDWCRVEGECNERQGKCRRARADRRRLSVRCRQINAAASAIKQKRRRVDKGPRQILDAGQPMQFGLSLCRRQCLRQTLILGILLKIILLQGRVLLGRTTISLDLQDRSDFGGLRVSFLKGRLGHGDRHAELTQRMSSVREILGNLD